MVSICCMVTKHKTSSSQLFVHEMHQHVCAIIAGMSGQPEAACSVRKKGRSTAPS